MQRQKYLQKLRELIPIYGSDNIVYVDESGFQDHVQRDSGWAPRGKKIYADVQGKYNPTTNLIMAQRGREWLAPMLFQKSCTAQTVNAWLEKMLLKELTKPSIIIMDNAPFHSKPHIIALLESYGHYALFLPPYSPDLNPIEQSFAILKNRRLQNIKLDNLLMQKFI
jgi:transposase